MNGTQTFILECGRINSVGVSGGGEDFDNKSSWTNQTAPIILRQGDTVALQNVLINVGGADTNSIQFQGVGATPTNSIQDNFTLIKVGFFINHNGIYTASLPLKYTRQGGGSNGYLEINTSQTITAGPNRTNNEQGLYHNYNYFEDTNDTEQILPIGNRIAKINAISSLNPFSPMNGSKFAVIDPSYYGWMRPNNETGNGENLVDNIKLLEQDIPILLPQGFVSPTGIADLVTNIMSYTSTKVRDPADTITATSNKYKQDEGAQADKVELKAYAVNGYTYKTIRCNLLGETHKIYSGGMAVDEPYQWLYGIQILSNASTDNMILNKRYFNQTNDPDTASVDYPVLVWQRFIGDNTSDFDIGLEGRTGQYSNYSPALTEIDLTKGTDIIQVSGMETNFIGFNDFYTLVKPTGIGFYLAQLSSTSYKIVRTDIIGTGLIYDFGLYVDNDHPSYTQLIAYRRFNSFNGTFTADEHQIFKTTNLGDPDTPANTNPYQFSGAVGLPSSDFFTYPQASNRTITMGRADDNLGFIGYVNIFNVLTEDSGGIVAGGEYKISFTATIQGGYSWSNTVISVEGNGVGLSFNSFSSDGLHEVEFTATGSSIAANAIVFGVYYKDIGAVVDVSDISILRENLNQDDNYTISNVWINDTTNVEDNKLYSLTKNNGLSNLECVVSGNTVFQPIYVGVDYNRTYKVITRGLVLSFSGGNFSCINILNGHDPNVALLYNDDDPDYTYWIYQGYSNPGLWYSYRLSKYQGGIPENGTVLGSIQSGASITKHPNRAGQQYYDFSVGNTWTYERDTPDFNAGNTWGNTLASPLQYTATNHQPPLTLNYQIYLKNKTYTGGTATYTYSFQDAEGITVNGNEYDSIFTIDTNTGTIYTAYLLTDRVNGLSGIFEFNNSTAGNTWTITTTGGHNGFGYIQFAGAFGTLLSPTTAWVVNNIAFNYDWDLDATPAGYTQDYLLSIDPNNLKQGSYIYFPSNNNIAYTSIGTYTYDDNTRTISLYRRGSGTLQNSLITAVNPVPNLNYTTSISSHIAQTLPTVDTGAVAGVVQYFASFDIYLSGNPNLTTLYLGANQNGGGDDISKEGQRGRLVWQDAGVWNATSWDWNGATYIDLDINGTNLSLSYSGTAPSLTNIVEYPTSQNFIVNANTYSVPIDGIQYGSGYSVFGSTTTTQASGGTEYLGFNTATQPNNTLQITEGFVYNNINDSFANNNGKKWKLTQFGGGYKITITSVTDGSLILSVFNDGTAMLVDGWTLIRADKKLDSEILSSGPDGQVFTNCSIQGYFTSLFQNNQSSTGPETDDDAGIAYQVYENSTFTTIADRGTFQTYDGANITTTHADMRQSQLLMTNINCTINNLEKIKNYFRYNEFYSGGENTRTTIANDTRNFSVVFDLGRSNDASLDFTETSSSLNQTGRTPYIPNYLRDQGVMGIDNGNDDTISMGAICPVKRDDDKLENRIEIFTGWLGEYENRIKAVGMYGNIVQPDTGVPNYCYGNSITTEQFKNGYKKQDDTFVDTSELYNKCVNENIGIIPFINKESGDLMIGFELFKDYIGDIYKIQNLSWFGYSPSTIDHKYVMMFNNDAPAIKDSDGGDYNYTARQSDQMNFLQVGATQPAMKYNNDLNKFTLRYFHTPTFFNQATGTDTNIGQEIAKLFDNSPMVIFRDHCYQLSPEKLADDNRRNIGINDSQSGIFLKDVFFQKVQNNNFQITSSNNSFAVQMAKDNFYNTLWFKLGFSYYDLKPLRFKNGSFNNSRFNNLTYNNISTEFRNDSLVPFTTNSLFNINFAPLMNIFTQNTGVEGTKNPNVGTEIYGLGFNNNLPADVEVTSDSLFPASIPVNISSGYYRIYTDLPIDTLTYTSGGSNLAVIGSALLNYASSQQFFFSYGMDYGATITKDTLINNVKIEIRDDRGALVRGLGDRSLVVIKITRAIQLTEPPPDPNTKELQDIENDLEELVKETKEDNLKDDLKDANAVIASVGIGDALQTSQPQNQIDTPEEISNFIDNFNIQMIQNLVSRTLVRAGDDSKDVGRRVATGIAQYFLRKDNIKQFNRITKDLFNEGIDATLAKPYVAKFVDSMNKFYINVDGKALKGSRRQPEVATISDEGALVLYERIGRAIQDNPKIKESALSAELFEDINNLFGTDNMKIFDPEDPGLVEAVPAYVTGDLDIEDFEVKKIVERGFKENKRGELKKLFLDYGSVENYLNLYGFNTQGASPEDKKEAIEEIKESGPDLDNMKELYKELGKLVLKDDPAEFVRQLAKLNIIIKDVIGTRLYDKFDAVLEENQNLPALTGITAQKPQKRLRRQKKEVEEAKDMEAEDKDAPEGEDKPTTPKTRKRRTKKEMEEAKSMGAEDKPKPPVGRPTKERARLMAQEGAEDSPLRQKGRQILADRERQKVGGGAPADK